MTTTLYTSFAAVTMLAGCFAEDANPNQSLSLLQNAQTVTVLEQQVSIGNDYDIMVGEQRVATVSGEDIKIWTDRFDLKTIDGQLLAYETESARFGILWRAATFYDPKGQVTGYLGEELGSRAFGLIAPYYVFHFYDSTQQETGASEKLTNSVLGRHKIYDANGNLDYTVDKQLRANMLVDKYELTVHDKTDIPLEHALLLVCIEDAIGDSQKSSSGTKKKESKSDK